MELVLARDEEPEASVEALGAVAAADAENHGHSAALGLDQEVTEHCPADATAPGLGQERDVHDEDAVARTIDEEPSHILAVDHDDAAVGVRVLHGTRALLGLPLHLEEGVDLRITPAPGRHLVQPRGPVHAPQELPVSRAGWPRAHVLGACGDCLAQSPRSLEQLLGN